MDDDTEVSGVRRRMLEIRTGLSDDVRAIKHHANRLADWRFYVRQYPWAALGAAAAVGYLIVPKRSRVVHIDAEALATLAKRQELVVGTKNAKQQSKGIFATLLSLAAGMLWQVGKNFATAQAKEYFVSGRKPFASAFANGKH